MDLFSVLINVGSEPPCFMQGRIEKNKYKAEEKYKSQQDADDARIFSICGSLHFVSPAFRCRKLYFAGKTDNQVKHSIPKGCTKMKYGLWKMKDNERYKKAGSSYAKKVKVALLTILTAALLVSGCGAPQKYESTGVGMGTIITQTLYVKGNAKEVSDKVKKLVWTRSRRFPGA